MRMVRVDFAGVEWRSRADEDVLATFVGCGVEVTCMAYMFRVPVGHICWVWGGGNMHGLYVSCSS